jgi:hypothetical protein
MAPGKRQYGSEGLLKRGGGGRSAGGKRRLRPTDKIRKVLRYCFVAHVPEADDDARRPGVH